MCLWEGLLLHTSYEAPYGHTPSLLPNQCVRCCHLCAPSVAWHGLLPAGSVITRCGFGLGALGTS